jgi:CHAD domain-containing protein
VRESASLWKLRAVSLERARKSLERGDPEGLHDFRVALRRLGATAKALGKKRVSRQARAMARSLASPRQLEVDRQLLARVGRLGLLSPDAVTALAARWEKLAARGDRRRARASDGRAIHRLVRSVTRLSRRGRGGAAERIAIARRRAEAALGRSLEGGDDRALHRYRRAVKKARYMAEDLSALGRREWKLPAERERAVQERFGRWNDLRMFCLRLADSRKEAEERGSMSLASELGRLLAALEPTIAAVRAAAVEASRQSASVLPIALRSA